MTLLLLAALAGVVAAKKSLRIGLVLVGVLGVDRCAARRPAAHRAGLVSAFPSLVGAVAAGAALYLLLGRASRTAPAGADLQEGEPEGSGRRRFLLTSGGVLALAAVRRHAPAAP